MGGVQKKGGGTKHFPKERKSRDLYLFTTSCLLDSQAFRTCYFFSKVNLQDFLDFLLVSVTSGTVLQNGVRERVVSTSHSDVRSSRKVHSHSVPSNFFQITGLVFSFSVFKMFKLLSSLLVFSPFWGSRYLRELVLTIISLGEM